MKQEKIIRSQTMRIEFFHDDSNLKQYIMKDCVGYPRFIWNKITEILINDYEDLALLNEEKDYLLALQDITYRIKDKKDRIQWLKDHNLNRKDDRKYDIYFEEKMPCSIRDTTLERYRQSIISSFKSKGSKKGKIKLHFKKKSFNESFTFDFTKGKINYFKLENGLILFKIGFGRQCTIPEKQRYIIMKESIREEFLSLKADIKRVTIINKNNKFYANFQIELSENPKYHYTQQELNYRKRKCGIDLGVKTFATIFDGTDCYEFNHNKPKIKTLLCQIDLHHRNLSRKYVKGEKVQSNSYYKELLKMNRSYRKLSNMIKDNLKKFAVDLCKSYEIINLEDLDILSMTKKKKGKKRQNYLHRKILLQNWGFFVNFLQQIAPKYNTKINFVPRNYPSTQTCSSCGNVKKYHKKMKLNHRTYKCEICSNELDRDLNAAINIYNKI
jgi:putative transposase